MLTVGGDGFRFRFLGGCEILGPAGPVRLESAKTTAVLLRLALGGGREPRARLVGWLWPELPEERASSNLRRAVWDLRRRLVGTDGTPLVAASRSDLALDPVVPYRLDVDDLRAALAGAGAAVDLADRVGLLRRAAELYRGELLAGYFCDGAPELEEWILLEREAIRTEAMAGLELLVEELRAAGEAREALAWARRAVAFDPWREGTHRAVIEILAAAGERAAALAQYETLCRLLAEELQTEPSSSLAALAERLRSEPTRGAPPIPLPPVHNLPAQATPFVGREVELDEVLRRLADPSCRLLCLVGPGGIGKTRLAVQAAHRLLAQGPAGSPAADGVAFVPPLPGNNSGRLVAAVASALGLAPALEEGAGDPRRRLVEVLRERRVVLLVDGAEHLGPERELLAEVIAAAPEVTVLATSRERLHLPGEWVAEIGGLGLDAAAGRAARADAVELFLQAARRASVGFRAGADGLERVEGLCRRLGGSPLGIELAAGWLGPFDLAELDDELRRDLSLLASPGLGRRLSLEAVFEASFERLDDKERTALLALSVFEEGIPRAEAEEVAGAGLRTLAELTDRSFLRREPSGRHAMHEVLLHFARRRLGLDPELERQALERHARAFGRLAADLAPALQGGGQRHALATVETELDNLRAAWRHAVGHRDLDLLGQLLDAVAGFCVLKGRFEEGEQLLGDALTTVAEEHLRSRLLVARAGVRNRLARCLEAEADAREALERGCEGSVAAWARFHLADAAYLSGRFADARSQLEALAGSDGLASDPSLAVAVWSRSGRVALEVGRLDEAARAFQGALDAATAAGVEVAAAAAVAQLGHVAYFRGDLDAAVAAFERALAIAREAADRTGTVQALHGLAYVADDRGRHDESAELYREALALCRALGDRRGVAYTLMLLGENARLRGDPERSRSEAEAALEAARGIGSQYLVGLLLGNLAYVEATVGDLRAARGRVRETLLAYRESGSFTVGLPALVALAEVWHREGRPDEALELLGLVSAHPANRQDHQVEVERVVGILRSTLLTGEVEAGMQRGADLDLDRVVDRLLAGDDLDL